MYKQLLVLVSNAQKLKEAMLVKTKKIPIWPIKAVSMRDAIGSAVKAIAAGIAMVAISTPSSSGFRADLLTNKRTRIGFEHITQLKRISSVYRQSHKHKGSLDFLVSSYQDKQSERALNANCMFISKHLVSLQTH